MFIKKIIFLSFSLLILFSCSEEMSGPMSVHKLKLLSIKVDKPQAHPADKIKVNVLIGKPQNYTEEYHSITLLCDPKTEGNLGNSFFNCMNPEKANLISKPIIDKEEMEITIPEDSLSKDPLDKKYLYLIYILCESDMNTCMNSASEKNSSLLKISLKRIVVINKVKEIKNRNPIIKNVYLNDRIISDTIVFEEQNNNFKVEIDKNSFDKKDDGSYEEMVITWYASRGEFYNYYTDQYFDDEELDINNFYIKSGGTYNLYIVVSDKRGGFDWRIITVTD